MIVWTGAGVLVLFIGIAGYALGYAIGGQEHGALGGGLGTILGAVGIWFAGRALNNPAKARVLVDPQTGQQVVLQKTHTFFWVKMEWWAIVVVIIGVYAIFAK